MEPKARELQGECIEPKQFDTRRRVGKIGLTARGTEKSCLNLLISSLSKCNLYPNARPTLPTRVAYSPRVARYTRSFVSLLWLHRSAQTILNRLRLSNPRHSSPCCDFVAFRMALAQSACRYPLRGGGLIRGASAPLGHPLR